MDRHAEPISLSPSTEKFVARQVELGRYSSAREVVERGVQLLAQEETLLALDIATLPRKLDRPARQIARGDVMDRETFSAELRREDRARPAARAKKQRPASKR